ncbi:MAG: putative baseplate assembly protein, partial [Geminicoccaceae bacterium]
MPIPRYMLADLDAQALAQELVRRIPAHTPEWRNPRVGDPGRTLIDLFAWLAETLLYRVNLIPERQRLEFLRLLNMPLRPAQPARALVQLGMASPDQSNPVPVPRGTPVVGPVAFETVGD